MVHFIWLPVNIISGETSDESEKESRECDLPYHENIWTSDRL